MDAEKVLQAKVAPVVANAPSTVTDQSLTAQVVNAVTSDPTIAVVPVKSPWFSKVNITAVVTAAISLAAALGFVIPEEYQKLALEIAGTIGPVLVVVMKTWFTPTVSSASVGK